jgi:hypothetical protein
MMFRRSKNKTWEVQDKAPSPPRYRSGIMRIKQLLMALIVIAVVVEIVGLPHLRLHTEAGSGIYWSITGKQAVPITAPSGRPPVLRMIKLDPSPIEYAGHGAKWAWSRVQQQVMKH